MLDLADILCHAAGLKSPHASSFSSKILINLFKAKRERVSDKVDKPARYFLNYGGQL